LDQSEQAIRLLMSVKIALRKQGMRLADFSDSLYTFVAVSIVSSSVGWYGSSGKIIAEVLAMQTQSGLETKHRSSNRPNKFKTWFTWDNEISCKPSRKSCCVEGNNIFEVSTVDHVALGILKTPKTIYWSLSDSLLEINWIADRWFAYIWNSDDGGIYEHVMYIEIPGRESFIHRNSMSFVSSDVITWDVNSQSTAIKTPPPRRDGRSSL